MSVETSGKQHRIGYRGWVGIGIISGLLAFLFVPIVFGPIAILSGAMVFRRYNELHGIALVLFGGIATVVGVVLGFYIGYTGLFVLV